MDTVSNGQEVKMMKYQKILIVDDSATSRMIIRRCFEMTGYIDSKFFEAEDGLAAISFLEQETVDLILSDLKMPRMDGYTFIKKLKMKDKTKNIPVVVISSMGNDITQTQLIEAGAEAIIMKPLSLDKISDVLEGMG